MGRDSSRCNLEHLTMPSAGPFISGKLIFELERGCSGSGTL